MSADFFVLLRNPSNGARFALVKDLGQEIMMFETIEEAEESARRTLFGNGGYFSVHNVTMSED